MSKPLLADITARALDPEKTDDIFLQYKALFPEICSRWIANENDIVAQTCAYARVLPLAPYLSEYTIYLFNKLDITNLLDIVPNPPIHATSLSSPDARLRELLLALFRLLSFDNITFAKYVQPARLQILLANPDRVVRYLSIRIICLYLWSSDAGMEEMLERYLGSDLVDGNWEGKEIDYRFLSLWEEKRYATLAKMGGQRVLREEEILATSEMMDKTSSLCCNVHGILLPRPSGEDEGLGSTLVPTSTTVSNLRRLAQELMHDKPLLLTGLAGAGKSTTLLHLARLLGKADSLISLHLNEQSDVKILIGLHTTGSTPGTFSWQPGVLTTAVREGRWVFIEDIDRAPNEIMSALLSLIERREIHIPSQSQTLTAARGFKIIATMRSFNSLRGDQVVAKPNMIGSRFWSKVTIESPTVAELQDIIIGRYPRLKGHITAMMASFKKLSSGSALLSKNDALARARPLTTRDLMKWCHRVSCSLRSENNVTAEEIDAMFLDAYDCFAGSFGDEESQRNIMTCVAEELHIDVQRRDHLLSNRDFDLQEVEDALKVGRARIEKSLRSVKAKRDGRPFSINPYTGRLLEKLARAVSCREPLLLVGETGTGKTTCIQHLADRVGQKMIAFNLSQQSESGDLLGGFKPVNIRNFIIPLQDEFLEIFWASFANEKKQKMDENQKFITILSKSVARSEWKRVCKLWRIALKTVDTKRLKQVQKAADQPQKKRKLEHGITSSLDERWRRFASDLEAVETRLSKNTDGFAFAFQEGGIITAARNGHWVLLDEINLASPDTLEALSSLFDFEGQPSILLSETGSTERIRAHPDFRIFAAMNPATDVGKKDLPPGIRSRFTELYVQSPDSDEKSLRHIVSSYLGAHASNKQLAEKATQLYRAIQRDVHNNFLVDGAGQKPHFSLRTLTRALTYAKDMEGVCLLTRGLYEGFHMSFCTFLNGASEQRISPLIEKALFQDGKSRSELKKPIMRPKNDKNYVQEGQHWLRVGPFPIQDEQQYIITPFVRRNLNNLIRATSTRRYPVLIQGPTSSGKTSMVEYLAKRTGNKFLRINNHEHTDLQEYLGTYVSINGVLQFQEGVLVRALREGHWIVLDELNLAPTDVLEALNRLLDDNRELLIPETQEVVRPHENFMLFATQNPAGLYGGRKILSRAFRNRFLELHFDDIPVDELTEILHKRTQIPESWCKRIVKVYRELALLRQEDRMFEQKSFATLRDLFRWALRKAETIQDLANNGFMLLAERVRKDEERQALKSIIEKVMSKGSVRVSIDLESLYATHGTFAQRFTMSNVVWTKAMRRLYTLVAEALRNNEPVLLVGETGCGKTTVVQILARALGTTLHILNAHQNTETGDIIGSQRPIRNRAALESELQERLKAVVSSSTLESSSTIEDMLRTYDLLVPDQFGGIAEHEQEAIRVLRDRIKSLFEWSDGSLVQAMKEGSFYLLDEISLADDSVLERLNSVLEPQKTLLLAEKGPVDSFVVAKEGFQFLATMNPGGDYGKRELSPALRNRFTEIWVPALSDTEDVLQIVQARLCESVKPIASSMVAFAQWFNQRFNTSASATVSIRDMLSWIEFINNSPRSDVMHAVVHGAAMVYIDTLGANPAAMLASSSANVAIERRQCVIQLGSLLRGDFTGLYQSSTIVQFRNDTIQFGPFLIPRVAHQSIDAGFFFDAPTTRSNAMRIVRALQLTKPVLLEGSPGVGKTTLVTALANATGAPLTRINLSDQTDLIDLFGSDVPVEGEAAGIFAWRDAPFLRAMKNGEWVLLDEMNLASQSILEGLNACLDHRGEVYISELDQTFHRHPNFRLFAAQNPHHQGGGRKGLPASFVNRFTVVYTDVFTPEDLSLICRHSFPEVSVDVSSKMIEYVARLHTEVVTLRNFGQEGSPWEFNLRDTQRWMELASSRESFLCAGTARDFLELVFVQKFRRDVDRQKSLRLFSDVFGEAIPEKSYYHNLDAAAFQVGLGFLHRRTAPAPHPSHSSLSLTQLPFLESLFIAVQKTWPVILTGPAGSGKSSLIQSVASLIGAKTNVFSMNADVDAMDLIGGYEQVDPARKLNSFITRVSVYAKHRLSLAMQQNSEASYTMALMKLENLTRSGASPDEYVSCLHTLLEERAHPENAQLLREAKELGQLRQRMDGARFEWVDGILVEALTLGHWLVLDNANFCSPSVLDRLNSLLEPNGVLSVNENATDDGVTRIIKPHVDFRIFLTVDPRYGELSRAMRNRAVEIFLLPDNANTGPKSDSTLPLYLGESSMYRYRHAVQALQNIDQIRHDVASISADHISMRDVQSFQSFAAQVAIGLSEPDRTEHPLTNSGQINGDLSKVSASVRSQQVASTLNDFLYAAQLQAQRILACYNENTFLSSLNEVTQQAQPLCPTNNEFLARGTQSFLLSSEMIQVAMDLILNSGAMQRKFDNKEISSSRQSHRKQVQKIQDFLRNVTHSMQKWLADEAAVRSLDKTNIAVFRILLPAWWNLFRLLDARQFDSARFNFIAHILGEELRKCAAVTLENPDSRNIAAVLFEHFKAVGANIKLSSGLGMEWLWGLLKPPMPRNEQELRNLIQLDQIGSRFDDLALRTEQPLSILSKVRTSLSNAMALAAFQQTNLDHLLPELTKSVAMMDMSEAVPYSSLFEVPFRILSQTLALKGRLSAQTRELVAAAGVLGKLSTRPNVQDQSPSSQLQRIIDYTGLTEETAHPLSMVEDFASEALITLKNTQSTTLADLDSLEEELRTLSSLSASDPSVTFTGVRDSLDKILIHLVKEICDIDGAALGSSEIEALKSLIKLTEDISTVPHSSTAATLRDISRAWLSLGSIGLRLYVPNIAFDPALRPEVELDFRMYHRKRLEDKLNGLQHYEASFTGQNSSLRIQLCETQLQQLDDKPQTSTVFRANSAKIEKVQVEFELLLQRGLATVDLDHLEKLAEDTNVNGTVQQLAKRLKSMDRDYWDVTMPAIGFLSCMKLGIAWYNRSFLEAGQGTNLGQSLRGPLINKTIGLFPDTLPFGGDVSSNSNVWHDLHAVQVTRSVERDFQPSKQEKILIGDLFYMIFQEWNKRLEMESKEHAANSSLYQYRDLDASGEAEEQEDRDLFPNYESDNDQADGSGNSASSKRNTANSELAITLANFHAEVFIGATAPSSLVRRMIDHVATSISQSPDGPPIETIQLLPMLYLQLQKQSEYLSHSTAIPGNYNFYLDQNLEEARKFLILTRRTAHRFKIIRTAWPEHDTISEVLRHCDEGSQFRFIEPIAKLITKAEKIQSTVYQWQQVASREYSVSPIYDDWTALIVGWRKLELTTWPKLFDMEVQKTTEEAKLWWFVAYQAIVAATKDKEPESPDDELNAFAKDLMDALHKFFSETTLGQYTPRLNLLRQIHAHLSWFCESHRPTAVTHRALGNFIEYYSRFEGSVLTSIQTLRKPLERNIVDTIKLATYKDTNIDALRQSAKQSHQKLTKAVRKFRAVLNRPVGSLLEGEMSRTSQDDAKALARSSIDSNLDSSVDEACRNRLPRWLDRPKRFQALDSTTSLMASKVHVSANSVDATRYLQSFLSNLENNLSHLRKDTPSILNNETKNTVKNLRAQKRKLFVETLKDVRQMGFKSNLGGDALATQESLSAVLQRLPDASLTMNLLQDSSLDLHRTLQIMPNARAVSKEHHADISPAEVVRSVGYLESILRLSLKQRTTIANALADYNSWTDYLVRLRNMWKPEKYSILLPGQADASASLPNLQKKLCWIIVMVDVTISVLNAQAKLGDISLSSVVEELQSHARILSSLKEACSQAPTLPEWLPTTAKRILMQNMLQAFSDIDATIENFSTDGHPAKPALGQLQPWLFRSIATTSPALDQSLKTPAIDCLQNDVFDLVDKLLAIVQGLPDILSALPTSVEDSAWLINHETILAAAARGIYLSRAVDAATIVFDRLKEILAATDANGDDLQAATAIVASVMPILDQYSSCAASIINRYMDVHAWTTKMLYRLAKTFVQIGSQGFCTPPEKSDEKSGKDEKLEAGTGLGEGEGAEDISKDIEDDEDLTELAQEPGNKDQDEEIEDQKDAVDMADQDMEGQMGDVEEQGEEGDEGSDAEDQDVEEDVGDVDDLGPTTLDEKMWDEGGDDNEKEKEGDQGTGQEDKNEQVASGDKERQEKEGEEGEEDDEMTTGNEEAENGAQDDVEKTDPHLEESERLDIPDDLNMDEQKSEADSDDLGDLDGVDDVEDPAQEAGADTAENEEETAGEDDQQLADSGDVDPTNSDDEEIIQEDETTGYEEADGEEEDQNEQDEPDDNVHDIGDNANEHTAEDASADVGAGEQALEQDQQNQKATAGAAQQEDGPEGDTSEPQQPSAASTGTQERSATASGVGKGEDAEETPESQAFKKMGDVLERWHKQQRDILDSSKDIDEARDERDMDMADADFEHLPDDNIPSDAQALGTATEEQARALDDDMALPSNETKNEDASEQYAMDVDEPETDLTEPASAQQDNQDVKQNDAETDGRPNTFVGAPPKPQDLADNAITDDDMEIDNEVLDDEGEEQVNGVDARLAETHLDTTEYSRSETEARTLWTQHENSTRTLAQSLTEHLRLILEPTSATKLRGDFRTGKRLNLKRIIPYIASSYKRDKIWLRRSLPSKRAYQIMLAVDDSRSMADPGTIDLAFETLALVSKALTMLEAGELCIVGFGSDVRVAHPFDRPFTSDTGVNVLKQFGFQQEKTDVKKLVQQSIGIFQDARLKANSSGQDLWQLQIILSDGICDSHEEIMRLVRQAQEERIMIVFVIVDAMANQGTQSKTGNGNQGSDKKQSILDMRSVAEDFTLRNYMDTFPFRWYLVVRDIAELPGVLAIALRQWFKEVVDSS